MSSIPQWIQHVERHAKLPSTNDRGLDLARDDGVNLPALVIAGRQTAGRGRGQNQWWSGDGALTLSLVLDTVNPLGISLSNAGLAGNRGLAVRDWPKLSLTTAVAVCDMLDQVAPDISWGIKWPNDVVIADSKRRKIAGILIESPGKTADTSRRIVVGVGMNINNGFQNAPAAIRERGVALRDLTGSEHDLGIVQSGFLLAFAKRLRQQLADDLQLAETWHKRCVLQDSLLTVEQDKQYVGICRGVDSDGALLLDIDGNTRQFFSGTVRN